MAASPQQQVWSTPELLESVLLPLDPRTLLVSAQRVCRTWTSLIRESSAIQKALFFTPVEGVSTEKAHNPLLAAAFPSLFHTINTDSEDEEEFSFEGLDIVQHPEKRAVYFRPEASWRNMLVQQPPTHKLAVWKSSFSWWNTYIYFEIPGDSSKTQNGLRMETFFEALFLDDEVMFDIANRKEIIWWGRAPGLEKQIRRLEKLGGFKLDADIVVFTSSSGQCYEDEDEDENENAEPKPARKPNLGEQLTAQIRETYRELGLTPKCTEEGWRSAIREFDFEVGQDGEIS
ncbi:hypothetical protein NUU61_003096 [Penicillium alfredii]|uniref:F-box domain-containing protein n=1 Tax=Penicillium alfredii TaxID=1506179 RepID=A0A9W9KGJ8_9EURO|nr:uncharacterized protein NUU61_003096 [Penicillium alfredii]KAJ5105749.1 hypothetical protein NUU61_003096 [Penicillium alfredii]